MISAGDNSLDRKEVFIDHPVIDISVKSVDPKEAVVHTNEYWCLVRMRVGGSSGKKILALLMGLAVDVLFAPPAQAVVAGTSHALTTGDLSQCSVCHLQHDGGSRLWPVTPNTNASFIGVVSTLCGQCHHSAGGYGATFAAGNSDARVYGANSHGLQMTITEIPDGSALTASALPYTGSAGQVAPTGGVIECTSCHNVHDDVLRPFLRASMNTICTKCHSNRNFQAGTDSSGSGSTFAAWGATIRYKNPGSHPVGTDITGDVTVAGNSPITFPAESVVLMSTVANNWGLGGHLSTDGDTGAVGCNTCHAVHGIEADTGETAPPATISPTANMLIFAQASSANEGLSGRTIANGDGSYNRFCEECHTGTDPTGYAQANSNPNPGGTGFTHPVDSMNSQYAAGVAGFPANWPVGGAPATAGTNVAPSIPICESCHTPHTAANNASRATITANAGPFILRDAPGTICALCHTSSFAGHHPVGIDVATAISGAGAAAYLTTGYTNMGTTMGCGTCHTAGGAHNWTATGGSIGLNTNWRPTNNGRNFTTPTADQYVGTGTGSSYFTSTTCMDCHLAMTSSANPSDGTIAGETGYQDLGDGSHYVGPFAQAWIADRTLRGETGTPTVNIGQNTDRRWPAGGWSRFGNVNTAPVLVCESCHELEPDRNGGSAHALLHPFVEADTNGQDYSPLCEGCHGVPAGTHPMTGNLVGRTAANLRSGGSYTAEWLRAEAPTALGGTSTWGTDQMSCNSCHQTHAAPDTGGTLIIEGPATNVTGGTRVNVSLGLVAGNGGVVANRVNNNFAGSALPNFSSFCDQCHSYLQ